MARLSVRAVSRVVPAPLPRRTFGVAMVAFPVEMPAAFAGETVLFAPADDVGAVAWVRFHVAIDTILPELHPALTVGVVVSESRGCRQKGDGEDGGFHSTALTIKTVPLAKNSINGSETSWGGGSSFFAIESSAVQVSMATEEIRETHSVIVSSDDNAFISPSYDMFAVMSSNAAIIDGGACLTGSGGAFLACVVTGLACFGSTCLRTLRGVVSIS